MARDLIPIISSIQLLDVAGIPTVLVLVSVIGGVIAAVGSLEGLFRYSDQWTQYRQSDEMLKIEGWSFFSLAGEYSEHDAHGDAYEEFADRVEEIVRLDVRSIMPKLAKKEDTEG